MQIPMQFTDQHASDIYNWELPSPAHPGDAGVDLRICTGYDRIGIVQLKPCDMVSFRPGETILFGLGIRLAIPPGYVGLLVERSSLHKHNLTLANKIGVIDSSYRGELKAAIRSVSDNPFPHVYGGNRLVQLLIVPHLTIEPVLAETLPNTQRGSGRFGSTGV